MQTVGPSLSLTYARCSATQGHLHKRALCKPCLHFTQVDCHLRLQIAHSSLQRPQLRPAKALQQLAVKAAPGLGSAGLLPCALRATARDIAVCTSQAEQHAEPLLKKSAEAPHNGSWLAVSRKPHSNGHRPWAKLKTEYESHHGQEQEVLVLQEDAAGAVKIVNAAGETLGYLSKEQAAAVSSVLRQGTLQHKGLTSTTPGQQAAMEALRMQLEDLDARMTAALGDLRAYSLFERNEVELCAHLAGLPEDARQRICELIDSGRGRLLGDGGQGQVFAVDLGPGREGGSGSSLQVAVKVAPLGDISTASPHHFRDLCTAYLAKHTPLSQHLEVPLLYFLRFVEGGEQGTEYFMYTVWPKRDCDLEQLLRKRQLQPLEVVRVMLHIATALRELCDNRMVHADVKPENVLLMLGSDGRVASAHLTDFGNLQLIPQGQPSGPGIWGELSWSWPPEQLDRVHLGATDVWGLAWTFRCLLLGFPLVATTALLQDPTVPDSDWEACRDTVLLPDLGPEFPEELQELMLLMRQCMARDPEQRLSLHELTGELQRLYDHMGADTRMVTDGLATVW